MLDLWKRWCHNHPGPGRRSQTDEGAPSDRESMSTPMDTTDTTYAEVVAAFLETDDLPQFWD